MTSVRITPASRSITPTIDDHPEHRRLSLKPEAPATGVVDGAWWPRSWDLAAEVPALRTALAPRLGSVGGVSYNLDDWGPTPRKIKIDGALVRLAGYRSLHCNTIDVHGARQHITLLVVAPEVTASVARATLRDAGTPANADGVETLLRTALDHSAGDRRGETDGGRPRSAPPA
jgi:hypothetical protein